MKENSKLITIFLIIFVCASLKIAYDSLNKNVSLQKKSVDISEKELLRKEIIQNKILQLEIKQFCSGTNYIPKVFLNTLEEEYAANFKKLKEILSKNFESNMDLAPIPDAINYVRSELKADFDNSKMSVEDYCNKYDFTEFYQRLFDDVAGIEF